MGIKGSATQEKILNITQHMVLQKGFSGTSIDEIIDQAGITKGGFFYHFKGKSDLAMRLITRYFKQDDAFFQSLFDRADSLSEDPLQQLLIFMKLFSEAMADLEDTHPGCLVASFTYESHQFDDHVRQLMAQGVLNWRTMFSSRFETILKTHPAKIDTRAEQLADMLTSIIEGGIVVSRVLASQKVLVEQLLQFRNYIRLLFDVK